MKKGLPKKESRWQREQKERKNKKRLSPLWTWLGLFLLLIVFGLFFKAYRVVKESRWDGKGRATVVLASEQVLVFSLEPSEPSLSVFLIPKGTQVEVIYGYGKYRVEAIHKLGQLEGKDELLSQSIQESFGLPVDGWVANKDIEIGDEDIKSKLSEVLILALKNGKKTDLTKWDLIRLWMQMKKVRSHKVNFIDLSKISVLTKTTLPDGSQIFMIDQNRLDPLVQKYFADPTVRKERLLIEVLNGTDHLKLGERAARVINSLGVEVVSVGNTQERVEQCQIRTVENKKNLYTVGKIAKIFGCHLEEKKEEGKADVTLIVGEAYWRKFSQK